MTSLGCRALRIADPTQDATIFAWLIYPAGAPATPHTFGPHTIELAMDAPVVGDRLPIVVVSHGMSGTPWGYRGLTSHLVREGIAVLLVEHPGDCRRDSSLSGTAATLGHRPRHVTLAIDAALAAVPQLRPDVAVVGHSMGGYTALAIAGGKPMALPNQTPDGIARPVDVRRDPRVRGVVLLGPAIPWFVAPGALAEVDVPVLVRTGEHDTDCPPFFVERILQSLPAHLVDYQVIPGAGHFAFFFPVPPALQRFPPGLDPPGFDRAAYQPQLHAELTRFVRDVT